MSMMFLGKMMALTMMASVLALSAFANNHASKKGLQGYHISSLVEQWGHPNSQKGNRYHWKECTYTGYVISQCQYGNCRSYRETTCCGQHITTDKDGIITGYSESGKGRCFNGINYRELSQHKRYAKDMYGVLGIANTQNGGYTAPYSVQTDVKLARSQVQQDCGGKCLKTYEFHNSCIANAIPTGVANPANYYYVAVNKDLGKARQNALKQCEKAHGQGACRLPTWDTGKQGMCALDYR